MFAEGLANFLHRESSNNSQDVVLIAHTCCGIPSFGKIKVQLRFSEILPSPVAPLVAHDSKHCHCYEASGVEYVNKLLF